MTSHREIDRLADDIANAGVSGQWLTPGDIGNMTDFKDAYILALRLGESIGIVRNDVRLH